MNDARNISLFFKGLMGRNVIAFQYLFRFVSAFQFFADFDCFLKASNFGGGFWK